MFLNLYFILDETWHFVKLNNEGRWNNLEREKEQPEHESDPSLVSLS